MNGAKIVKWLGFGCILAGIARMAMTPLSIIWGLDSNPELTTGLIACVLMSFVSLAFYAVQSKETGTLGFITVVGIMVGNILTACIVWGKMQYGHYGDEQSLLKTVTGIISAVGVLGGAVLLPILSWRAKVFPRWVIVLMPSMIFSMVLPWTMFFAFFWGLSYVAMGYSIWSGKLNRQQALTGSIAI